MPSTASNDGLLGTENSGSGGGLDVRRQMSLKLIFKHASKANSVSQIATTMKGMPVGEEEFEYNKDGQCDCKGGELLGKKKKKFPNTFGRTIR